MTSATLPSSTGIVSAYTYDPSRGRTDRITQVQPPSPAAAIDYTWDDNGNLVERGSDTFEWDFEDRMVEAAVNSVTSTFAYRGDPSAEGRSRTVGMTTTTFTWDINAGLPVVLDDGNQYLYGAGLSAMKQAGSWSFPGKDYLADGLGSTMAVVDSSGVVQKSYQYDVYGEVTGGTGSLANEFDFAGQQTDASTGLQYLRARYYDPGTGTFLSRDPMANRPDWMQSATSYGAADPISLMDPMGLYGTTKAESDWCTSWWGNVKSGGDRALKCFRANEWAKLTTKLTQEYFGEDVDDTAGNAFKHCCWIGLIAWQFDGDSARGIGLRHETRNWEELERDSAAQGVDWLYRQINMDLFNNEKGIAFAARAQKEFGHGARSRQAIIDMCKSAARSGELITSPAESRAAPWWSP